ncbi:hypothetical protein K7X08_020714 [Anisodus acutangulus]|uniref:Uncharacterized protein n=1 Tax=Anisodus acutangulus TaxID=402998 RepID=A0A9Q1MZ03_9SOLA|nr:hypothetical protein K7X08_020714 [Anisodus acutangulus]
MKPERRRWMYKKNYPSHRGWKEFVKGVAWFIDYAKSVSQICDEGMISDNKAFQRKTTQTARVSKKGGSVHEERLVTMRTRRRLAYERSLSHDEVFQDGKQNEYKV